MKIELSTVWGDGDASRLIREIRSELDVMICSLMASGVQIWKRGPETVIRTPFLEQ